MTASHLVSGQKSKPANMKNHANSTWHELTLEDVDVVFLQLNHTARPTLDTSLRTKSGERIYSNTSLFTMQVEIPPASPVLLDRKAFLAAKKILLKQSAKFAQNFQTLTAYFKLFPQHKIFLRTVSTTQRHEDRRVVASEVLELIPVLLARQQIVLKKLKTRLEKLHKKWACAPSPAIPFSTISMAELKKTLEDFNIDKSQITLVPDICFAAQVGYQFHTRSVNASICTTNELGNHSIHVSQAVFMLFNGVAMEVDWNTDIECTKHTTCNVATFRRNLLNQMSHYARMGERIFVKRYNLFHDMELLKMSCQYKSRETRPFTPGLDLLYCDYSDKIRLSYVFIKCQEFGFKHIKNTTGLTIHDLDAMYIPAWKARMVFMVLWMDMFFGDDEESEVLRKMVNQALSFKIPSTKWTEDCDILELVFTSDPEVLRREKEIAERNAVDLFESTVDTAEKYNEITHVWWNEKVVTKWLMNRSIIRCGKWTLQTAMINGVKSTNKVMSDYKEQARKEFPKNYKAEKEMAIKANDALMKILVENQRIHAAMPKEEKKPARVVKIDKCEAKVSGEGRVEVVMKPMFERVAAPDLNDLEPEPQPQQEPPSLIIARQYVSDFEKKLKERQYLRRKVNALNDKAKRGVRTLRVSRQLRFIINDALKIYENAYDEMQASLNKTLQKLAFEP